MLCAEPPVDRMCHEELHFKSKLKSELFSKIIYLLAEQIQKANSEEKRNASLKKNTYVRKARQTL